MTMSSASAAVGESAHEAESPVRESVAGRMGSDWANRLRALFGLPWQRRLARAALSVARIRDWEQKLDRLSDGELRDFGLRLRGRARGGENLDRMLPEAFGAVCVVAKRRLGLRPSDVQRAAGSVLPRGPLADWPTGGGKTLGAGRPTFLNALTGRGVHVTTVNDSLARRDAEWMGPIYESLGLSVGVLQQQMG